MNKTVKKISRFAVIGFISTSTLLPISSVWAEETTQPTAVTTLKKYHLYYLTRLEEKIVPVTFYEYLKFYISLTVSKVRLLAYVETFLILVF